MKISLYYDLVCPWCYLGFTRLRAVLRGYPADRVELVHQPFQLAPDLPSSVPAETYYQDRGFTPQRLRETRERVSSQGTPLGLVYDHARITVMPNTMDAHRLIRCAPPERRDAVATALFDAHHRRGLNLGTTLDLVRVAVEQGLGSAEDVTRFLSGSTERDEVRQEVAKAYTMPIITVPFMVVNDRFPVQFLHLDGVAAAAVENLWE